VRLSFQRSRRLDKERESTSFVYDFSIYIYDSCFSIFHKYLNMFESNGSSTQNLDERDEGEIMYSYVNVFKNPNKLPINIIHLEKRYLELRKDLPKDLVSVMYLKSSYAVYLFVLGCI
ncbi:unnamed protein product, partial [Callosobruchus maculatus]